MKKIKGFVLINNLVQLFSILEYGNQESEENR